MKKRTRQARRKSNRGFFDCHIIAILAAILFPVFAKAREKARQTSCLSNVKQLALGFTMYIQDYDEVCTPRNIVVAGANVWWPILLEPYIKNTQMFRCPSNQTGHNLGTITGYAYNFCPYNGGVSLATFKYPAETALALDWPYGCVKNTAAGGSSCANCPYDHSYWRVSGTSPSLPHNDGVNVALLDGHAKWLAGSTVRAAYANKTKLFDGIDP